MRYRLSGLQAGILAAGFLAWLAAGNARALPRYSARYEQNCGLCHVNPTGGGQRTLYAAQFIIPSEMAMRNATAEQLAGIDPQLSKSISIGLDLRWEDHHSDLPAASYENFLQMQGTFDLTFQFDPRFLGYVSKGQSTTSEVFGLAYVLPWNGYVKVGQFFPSYGWRFDDHTMFVRQKALSPSMSASDLGGPPGPMNDVGVEVGVFPARLALSAAVLNGNLGSIADNNQMPAYAAQGIYRFRVAGLGIGAGGSFFRNYESNGRRTAGGPYGYLKWKGLTWLGQSDWSRLRYDRGGSPPRVTDWTVSQELAFLAARGIELRGTYDFFDPDTGSKTGSRFRYGIGAEVMPYPFLMLHGMVNAHHFKKGAEVTGKDYTQAELQVHFFY